jgi:hypothetical protein
MEGPRPGTVEAYVGAELCLIRSLASSSASSLSRLNSKAAAAARARPAANDDTTSLGRYQSRFDAYSERRRSYLLGVCESRA